MLRREWVPDLLERAADLDLAYLEIFPENYLNRGPGHLAELDALNEHWPITSHGIHLSIGDTGEPGEAYVADLKAFLDHLDSPWTTDHLGVSIHDDEVLHEIVPFPLTEERADVVGRRSDALAERLGRPFGLENAAYYLQPPGTTLSDADFWVRLLSTSKVELLLDVNNLWVNAVNFGFDPVAWLDAVLADGRVERVRSIHMGGFTIDHATGLHIDSHGAAPSKPVYRLLVETLRRTGPRPICLEWEHNYRSVDDPLRQLEAIRRCWDEAASLSEGAS